MAVASLAHRWALRANVIGKRAARLLRLSMCFVSALVLMLAAMTIWIEIVAAANTAGRVFFGEQGEIERMLRFLAIGLAASGQFVFLYFVADEMLPRVPAWASGWCKLVTGVLAATALVTASLMAWMMRI